MGAMLVKTAIMHKRRRKATQQLLLLFMQVEYTYPLKARFNGTGKGHTLHTLERSELVPCLASPDFPTPTPIF